MWWPHHASFFSVFDSNMKFSETICNNLNLCIIKKKILLVKFTFIFSEIRIHRFSYVKFNMALHRKRKIGLHWSVFGAVTFSRVIMFIPVIPISGIKCNPLKKIEVVYLKFINIEWIIQINICLSHYFSWSLIKRKHIKMCLTVTGNKWSLRA